MMIPEVQLRWRNMCRVLHCVSKIHVMRILYNAFIHWARPRVIGYSEKIDFRRASQGKTNDSKRSLGEPAWVI